MKALLNWLEDRTGVCSFTHEALYERIPGGSRWRYVWGSTLTFAFMTQVITGIFLWMAYSPSSRTAWESVYYIQYEMTGGWLLRGIHHFMAQAMVVLLALHLLQVVIDGAYRAPREVNFWIGLGLGLLVLFLALTGYLLPWDQKGFSASSVATNLMVLVPVVGDDLQRLVVGGPEYGHHTLTRFFALHAGVLPGIMFALLFIHIAMFRRHGITTKPSSKPDQYFWPDMVLKDSVACLAVLAVVLLLCLKGFFTGAPTDNPGDYLGAHLSAPADPSSEYSAARPEWYFLSLFELLKYFEGGSEVIGAIVIPGVVVAIMFLMPLIGRWKLGHGFNIALLLAVFVAVTALTIRALHTDYYARIHSRETIDQYPEGSDERAAAEKRFRDSEDYLAALAQSDSDAHRIKDVIRHRGGVPYEGAVALMRRDSELQGRKLFVQYCASCHAHLAPDGSGIAGPIPPANSDDPFGAPNLYGFGSRDWMAGFLDPARIKTGDYYGNTALVDGEMVGIVEERLSDLSDDDQKARDQMVAALSAEANLANQSPASAEDIAAGRKVIAGETFGCIECHNFGDAEDGYGPTLNGWGSLAWTVGIIADPTHEGFYVDSNDRMPAFAPDEGTAILSKDDIVLISRWLRGDDRVLGNTTEASE